MKLPCIVVSDLHLTAAPADAYRWGLFDWLVGELQAEKAQTLIILGDITDAKDYHSATLVNLVVQAINKVRKVVPRVIILRGNHDYLKDGHMFFEFLSVLDGVEVLTKPTEDDDGELAYFLPYTKTPGADWKGFDFSHYRYLFLHQSVKGAVTSNGTALDGPLLPAFNAGKVYAGDIHVPQVIGDVEYIGAPYHVYYGDHFKGRAVVIDKKGEAFDLHYPTTARVMLDAVSLDELSQRIDYLHTGDQVKVRITLAEADKHQWATIKRDAAQMMRDAGLVLGGLELVVGKTRKRVTRTAPGAVMQPADVLYRWVQADDLGGELLDVGLECLE